jgi:hypothetical protein
MSIVINCSAAFDCNPAAAPDLREYLWYGDTSLAGINAQRVAVAAQIAAATPPTGFIEATLAPHVNLSGYPYGTTVWAFCVAATLSGGFTLASDTASKDVGA